MAGNNRVAPPIEHPIIEPEVGNTPTIPWTLFFDSTFRGDQGTDWTPNFVNLSSTGTPTITGRYYQLSGQIVYFRITVTPATNTSATAGTTYVDNFPLNIAFDGACLAMAGTTGSNAGHVVASTQRIYVPTWTNVTVPVTVTGMAEAG